MLKCSIFLPFSLEIKTESNTHFSGWCPKRCRNQFKNVEQAQKKKMRIDLVLSERMITFETASRNYSRSKILK